MVHPVDSLEGALFGRFTLLDERLQLIESFWHDRKVAILEEK